MGVSTKQTLSYKCLLSWVLLIFIVMYVDQAMAACSLSTAHSFLRPRSFSQNMALQYSMYNYSLYHMFRRDKPLPFFSYQVMGFYFTSTNKESLGQFFFPGNQQLLRVEQNNTSDISGPQLGLVRPSDANFKSFISIAPRRRVSGSAFSFFFDCGTYVNNVWADIFMPLVYVQHNLNFAEQQLSGNGIVPGIPNVTTALNNPNLQYGKFSPTTISNTGIDDILLRVGYDWINDPYGSRHVSPYIMVNFPIFPTAHRSNAEFIFEPTMGSGNHVGVGLGINADYWWWNFGLGQFGFFGDFRYAYFMKSDETRSFDLYNGDFSRYLQVAHVSNPFLRSPGINSFTQCVDVIPGNMMQFILGIHYSYANFHVEWGYNLWWRQREKVILLGEPLRDKAIFDIVGVICSNPTSASTAKISQGTPGFQQPLSDPCIVPLKNSDINLDSGTQPVSMSSTAYFSFGGDWFFGVVPNFVAIAFYYEFGNNRSTIEQVGGSFKYGFRY